MTTRTLNPDDIFLFEDLLGKEEKIVMHAAREYAQSKLEPRALEGNQRGIFHDEIPREMGQAGLLGAAISEVYGGGGKSQICYGLIARELERVDSGYRSFASVQSSLVMYPIEQFGTESQRNKFLPGLAKGDLIGCFALSEPDHGSDAGSMESSAVRV
ncbi:MAG: acyl-CoA dehydrogenase family protein, partial [Bacteroidetes bacterium]|nr:acyl-CoA dehydrogenase family protein [Bacteroidota bacterium]